MYAQTYRGYDVIIRLQAGKDTTECAIAQNGEVISVEVSSARARAVIDEWLNAR